MRIDCFRDKATFDDLVLALTLTVSAWHSRF